MTCGAAFIFDDDSQAALYGVWQSIAAAGISDFMAGLDYPPHMTIFTAEKMDMLKIHATLNELADRILPLTVTFPVIGVFPGKEAVIYLGPVINNALLEMHDRCFRIMEPYVSEIPDYYQPGLWVPHVTIGFGLTKGKVGGAIELLGKSKLPALARITGILYGDFNLQGGSHLERVLFTS